ncbi:hypothetical protein [Methylobacterium isbiliense]|jgi:hypothetical protein|uniref:Uncharacterized protein n=1 Tax=Methylobacterium isbiliense TaxID=315478 RepID=A0ABQ4SNX0_9HYPH|nr:hypothetical protein [Methylobacterium isbiliense]MDN3625943.1 hypothetical protein [Methylobacterium isbiliense]GJE04210.1 hypothetical protein GMJLKIPL_6171 [Methylobacterium isbiliense]
MPFVALGFDNDQVSLKLLNHGMQLAGIDSQFHALLLRLGECEPKLGVLDSEGEQIGLSAHTWSGPGSDQAKPHRSSERRL